MMNDFEAYAALSKALQISEIRQNEIN